MSQATKPDPTGAHTTTVGHPTGHRHVHGPGTQDRKALAWLSLGALGVVYGDIGTSPLYAMKECLAYGIKETADGTRVLANGLPASIHAVDPTPERVLGVVSLVFWSLLIVVFVKYLAIVLRADNKGEGGTLALAALVQQKLKSSRRLAFPILLALFGAGMLYGEGLITPAISVLSAVEGISEQNADFTHLVIPIAVVIIIGLFWVQRYGTGKIGAIFGWIMMLWFVSIGFAGAIAVFGNPEILAAVNPYYAASFLATNHWHGFFLLGSVVLCVTGCEALYADMGHFGKTPIRIAWTAVVFPGLLLNYFGQGALYLAEGRLVNNPFYGLVEGPMLIPMIVLATLAAIIASQALISGAFSLTNQAVQLGYLPRLTVIHTSSKHEGQIYIPEINWAFMVACVALVLAFKSSTNLAAAYGIAVTGLFMITSFMIFLVSRRNWGWSLGLALCFYIPFLVIDGAFFSANVVKIASGGWFPLAIGLGMFIIMTTWWRGRMELSQMMETGTIPDDLFLDDPDVKHMHRVQGAAVFMSSATGGIPNVMLHHVKHNKVLHKQVILLSVITENIPFAVGNTALTVRDLGQGFYRVASRVGFMQQPNVPKILLRCEKHGLSVNEADTTYYMGRQSLLTTGKTRMARWRKTLYGFLSHNSRSPTSFFNLPPNRVVELGLQIEL
ncbi:MAG: potassium transporter Kup [Deltaproteobacteria bacterium]|nr:potassium transporter Kup [Deltaproteobacteria bacterium]